MQLAGTPILWRRRLGPASRPAFLGKGGLDSSCRFSLRVPRLLSVAIFIKYEKQEAVKYRVQVDKVLEVTFTRWQELSSQEDEAAHTH